MYASMPQTVLRYTCLLSTATFECYTDHDLSRPLHQQKIQYAEDYGGGLQRRFNTQGSYSFRQFKFKNFFMPLRMKLKTNFTITKIEEKTHHLDTNMLILILTPICWSSCVVSVVWLRLSSHMRTNTFLLASATSWSEIQTCWYRSSYHHASGPNTLIAWDPFQPCRKLLVE